MGELGFQRRFLIFRYSVLWLWRLLRSSFLFWCGCNDMSVNSQSINNENWLEGLAVDFTLLNRSFKQTVTTCFALFSPGKLVLLFSIFSTINGKFWVYFIVNKICKVLGESVFSFSEIIWIVLCFSACERIAQRPLLVLFFEIKLKQNSIFIP